MRPTCARNGPPWSANEGIANAPDARIVSRSPTDGRVTPVSAPQIAVYSRPPMKRAVGTGLPNASTFASVSSSSRNTSSGLPCAITTIQVPVETTQKGSSRVARCARYDALLSWIPARILHSPERPVAATTSGIGGPSGVHALTRRPKRESHLIVLAKVEKSPCRGSQRSVWQPNEVGSHALTPHRRAAQYCGYGTIVARPNSRGNCRCCQKSCRPWLRPATRCAQSRARSRRSRNRCRLRREIRNP